VSRGFFAGWLLMLVAAAPALAQARAQSRVPGRFEYGGGVVWLGSGSLGSNDAVETTPTGSTSRLFSTTTTIASAPGVEGHIGFAVSPRFEAEAFGSFAKPAIRTVVSNDTEATAGVTATETVTQYLFGGGVVWYTAARSSPYVPTGAPQLRPFLSAGAAYTRQLHESNTLAETGQMFYGGAGVKYFFRSRTTKGFKGFGLRGDARIAAYRKGVAFEDRIRYSPVLAASVFARF